MDKVELTMFIVMLLFLFPMLSPILAFFICFYMGFKLVCKNDDIEILIRDYLVRKVRDIIDSDSDSMSSE